MSFYHFKMFVLAFWGICQGLDDQFELTNPNMVVLSDPSQYDENALDMGLSYKLNKSKVFSEHRSTIHPGTRLYMRKSMMMENDARESIARSSILQRRSKYKMNLKSKENNDPTNFDTELSEGKRQSRKLSIAQKKNSIFGGARKLKMVKNSKRDFRQLYELPFASVTEVNLIKKKNIEFYKDLLSIDKKGKYKKRKSAF